MFEILFKEITEREKLLKSKYKMFKLNFMKKGNHIIRKERLLINFSKNIPNKKEYRQKE